MLPNLLVTAWPAFLACQQALHMTQEEERSCIPYKPTSNYYLQHVRDILEKPYLPLKHNVFFIILQCGLLLYVALLPDVYGDVHTAILAF